VLLQRRPRRGERLCCPDGGLRTPSALLRGKAARPNERGYAGWYEGKGARRCAGARLASVRSRRRRAMRAIALRGVPACRSRTRPRSPRCTPVTHHAV
jgi:hypothetical protein